MYVGGDGFTMNVAGVDAEGNPLPLTANDAVLLEPDSFARLRGDGFAPGSTVDVWLHSQPLHLGRLSVEASGAFDARVAIPADVELGEHRIEVTGTTADGRQATVSLDAVAQRAAVKHSGTGNYLLLWILLLIIAVIIVAAFFWFILWRRRKREEEEEELEETADQPRH